MTRLADITVQEAIGEPLKFHLDTDHPVATDSPDHIEPRSTARDNSINLKFNKRLYELFKDRKPSVLDFGCAGGGMVKSFIDDGCIAVGLEGSDYNKMHLRAEWATIPGNLFTCDLGYEFTLHTGDHQPYRFDVVTAWEFIEHIPEKRLYTMIDNMRRHLRTNGLIIGSTTDAHSIWKVLDHHQTRKPMWWWAEQFGKHEFELRHDLVSHFDVDHAWVRSVKWNFVFQEDEF